MFWPALEPGKRQKRNSHKEAYAASPQPKLFGRYTPLLTEEGWLRH